MTQLPRVPTGFVKPTSDEVNPEGDPGFPDNLSQAEGWHKTECTLYTDCYGSNFFVLEHEGKQFVLAVGTD